MTATRHELIADPGTTIRYTTFPSLDDTHGREHASTWPELVARLRDWPTSIRKDACPLLKLATFTGTRSNENVDRVYGLEGDHDAGTMSARDAADRLAAHGIEAVIYTTASHQPGAPRWRVLVPLAQPCAPAARLRLVRLLNEVLGRVLASESKTLSQAFYFGPVAGVPHEFFEAHGKPIDALGLEIAYDVAEEPDDAPTADDVSPSPASPQDPGMARRALLAIPNGAGCNDDRGEWLKVLAAFKEAGGDEATALEWSARHPSYDEARVRKDWRSLKVGRKDGAPGDYLFRCAEEYEFNEHIVAMFPILKQSASPARPRFEVVPAATFARGKPPSWIIKGVLPRAQLVVLYGESGAGKSFVALDLGLAIARGVPWRERRVRQGRVAYIAAEGAGGFRTRLKAYATHHEVELDTVPFGVIADAPNFLQSGDVASVCDAVDVAGGADVVVVDTFAQVTPGADENTSGDFGKALAHCRRLHQATGAAVLLVHHAGKDPTKGARGWSGLRAAADAEILVGKLEAGERYIKTTKQKDGRDDAAWGFSLESVRIGIDEDGDLIESCVVIPADMPTIGKVGGSSQRRTGRWERLVIDTVAELPLDAGNGIEVGTVVDAVLRRAPPVEPGKRDTRRACVLRAIKGLSTGDDAPYHQELGLLTVV